MIGWVALIKMAIRDEFWKATTDPGKILEKKHLQKVQLFLSLVNTEMFTKLMTIIQRFAKEEKLKFGEIIIKTIT